MYVFILLGDHDSQLTLCTTLQALAIRQFLMTNLVKVSGSNFLGLRIPVQTLASHLDKMGDFPFKNTDEACYKGPTLFVRGIQSHYVTDDVLPVIGQFFPKFLIHDVDCGHWVISQRPENFRQGNIGASNQLALRTNIPSRCQLH